jgi:hypothetical protein
MILELLLASHLQELERRQAKGSLVRAAKESIHARQTRTASTPQFPVMAPRRLERCLAVNDEQAACSRIALVAD